MAVDRPPLPRARVREGDARESACDRPVDAIAARDATRTTTQCGRRKRRGRFQCREVRARLQFYERVQRQTPCYRGYLFVRLSLCPNFLIRDTEYAYSITCSIQKAKKRGGGRDEAFGTIVPRVETREFRGVQPTETHAGLADARRVRTPSRFPEDISTVALWLHEPPAHAARRSFFVRVRVAEPYRKRHAQPPPTCR